MVKYGWVKEGMLVIYEKNGMKGSIPLSPPKWIKDKSRCRSSMS